MKPLRNETLGEQLRREAGEYLADLIAIIRSLKKAEGQIAALLFLAVFVIMGIWFITSLGFNPPNDHVTAFLNNLGMRPCRPISNFFGVILFINLFVLGLLVVMSLGALFSMIERMRQGLPRDARELITMATLMLVFGVGGIIFMKAIC
jgi:amino acid transporter